MHVSNLLVPVKEVTDVIEIIGIMQSLSIHYQLHNCEPLCVPLVLTQSFIKISFLKLHVQFYVENMESLSGIKCDFGPLLCWNVQCFFRPQTLIEVVHAV